MAAREIHLARRHWSNALRAAAQGAVMGMLVVLTVTAVIMFGLWAWHAPDVHTHPYTIGCDRGNPWCGH